ncbi:MAG: glutamyl-tRNA amidotransferase [Candidatus Methanoprimaticola hominis]|nr:MAG: glutamyl-tRNA amidotransferase [Methanomassiliicoccales archaeon Mx-06]
MDRQTVERVARTAHIKLTEEELDRYSKDLGDILGYFELLDEAPECDSYGIDPIGVTDITREDEPRIEFDSDALLKDMNTYDRYVRGPRLS